MAVKPLNFGPFLRGVNASTDPYTIPKGAVPRASNMIMTSRGALTDCDGSGIINAVDGSVQTGPGAWGRFLSEFLFAPTGVQSYYLVLEKWSGIPLGAPLILSISADTSGGSLAAGTYFYMVTAIDGAGGETNTSPELNVVLSATGEITLTWNAVPNAFGYNVYRGNSSGSEKLLIGTGLPVVQPNPLGVVTFIDTGTSVTTMTFTGVTVVAQTPNPIPYSIFYSPTIGTIPSSSIFGQPIIASGFTPSDFNGTYNGSYQPAQNQIVATSGPTSGSGGGGTLVLNTSSPPISDTTSQTALIKMPVGAVDGEYDSTNIVAFFPAFLNGFGQVPSGASGGGGTTGPGISGQGSSTPSGGVQGLVSIIPQMVQFTNRVAIALGNGFAPQLYYDSTGTPTNPAFTGPITAITTSADQVIFTTSATLTSTNMPVGSNVIINVADSSYNSVYVIISVNTGAGTFTGRKVTSGLTSTGTFTVSTTPIVNTFIPAYPTWAEDSQYAVNSIVQPSSPTPNNSYFKAIQAGISNATTEPTWTNADTLGQEISDGTIIWQNQGPLQSGAPPPPGAGHIIVYSGILWVWNTSPKNTASGIDGPCSIRASDVNNPISWNPINQAFLDKDDGTEGMGLATFTISAEGIPPEGSLVAFKNYAGYQIVGVFGSSNFSIQRIRSDMGCFSPRSIWFAPGYGVVRYAHLGVALFDGVRDTVISEEMRPYLFPTNDYDVNDIVVADANWIPAAQGCLTANPPMYVLAIPIGQSNGTLTRILNYDLVLKCWGGPIDLPFSISCMTQVRPITSNPITIFGGYSDGVLQRWQAGDVEWYTGDPNAITPVIWSVQSPEAFGNPQDQKLHWRRLAIRGVATGGSPTLTVTPYINGVAKPAQRYTVPVNGDFELFAGIRMEGLRFNAIISGSGHLEISRLDFQLYPKAVGTPLVIS